MARDTRIGVVGGTGAVGTVTLGLLGEHGFDDVRVFASARSAGRNVQGHIVEEATPEALSRGDVDVFLFSVGTGASRELVPHAVAGGAIAIDKSSAYRLAGRDPARRSRGERRRARREREHHRQPELLHDPAHVRPQAAPRGRRARPRPRRDLPVGLGRRRAGDGPPREREPGDHDLRMDWDFDGEEFDEESKLRAETQKIMELPDLPIQATCVRVPVMVGHAEAVWIETEEPLSAEQARALLEAAPSVRVDDFPSPGKAAGIDEVLVGRIRRDPTVENGIALFLASDNLRKGAALNAIQIAELVLS